MAQSCTTKPYTIRQSVEGRLPQALSSHGILPGIKVDTGAKPMAGTSGESVTEGLDGLRDRLAEYYGMGARFAKWRAVFRITDMLPSDACVTANAHALGRYAALGPGAALGSDRRAGSADGGRPFRLSAVKRLPAQCYMPCSMPFSNRVF